MRARPELFSNMQDNSFEVVCTDRPFELMVGNGLVAIDRTSENGVDSIRVYDSVNDDEPVFDHDFPQGSVEDDETQMPESISDDGSIAVQTPQDEDGA